MKALWHLLYWPAVALSLLCIPLNCAVMLVSYIFVGVAQHAEKKLRK